MNSSESAAQPARNRLAPALTLLVGVGLAGGAVAAIWFAVGRSFWLEYQTMQAEMRDAADTVPIGYVGIHLRRTYNDRPPVFHFEKDGRKLLWAARAESGEPEFYDVTDAGFVVARLSGGFGRDSIPGIDYPIVEPPSGEHAKKLRQRQEVYGLMISTGPRVYPVDLLEKIELVNDRDGPTPFVVIYDRFRAEARLYLRTVNHRPVTFGTTGYADVKNPLLYDRRTRSLWLSNPEALVCVNGELKGTRLARFQPAERRSWSDWNARHPDSWVLIGSDRSRPIPSE